MHHIDPTTGTNRSARFVGRLPNGTRVHRCTVRVHRNERAAIGDPTDTRTHTYSILARSAADAANALRDEWAPIEACIEIHSWGPRGGHVHRYVGWESHVWSAMLERRDAPTQLTLFSECQS